MNVQPLIDEWRRGQRLEEFDESLARDPWEVVREIAARLREDLAIGELEGLEVVLKRAWRHLLAPPVSGTTGRRLAEVQRDLGFLLKYKSYAVKASSPLGYSIFLQEPGQGFSFQRHIEHKTEVFHVLDVLTGGFVFLCEFEDWVRDYDEGAFTRWLAGEADDRYERHRIWPQPGDTFVIEKLGVVHTVVGCVLEEFATISTDMVERLHDQNVGRAVPRHFQRALVEPRLAALPLPASDTLVSFQRDRGSRRAIPAKHVQAGHVTVLSTDPVGALVYRVEPGRTTVYQSDPKRTASIVVRAGHGHLIMGDSADVARTTPPAIALAAGELAIVPSGLHYAFTNDGRDELVVSEHRLPLEVAFH